MTENDQTTERQLTVIPAGKPREVASTFAASVAVPTIIAEAGDQAARRYLEFFAATIRAASRQECLALNSACSRRSSGVYRSGRSSASGTARYQQTPSRSCTDTR